MKSKSEKQTSFKIRRAKREDLSDILKMSGGVREIENYPGQRMRADDFIHFVGGRDAMMLVAVVPGTKRGKEELVGFVTVYRSENYFYLPYAVTKKGWRKHGVGGALLAEVERLAKDEKVEYILMSVYAYNKTVRTFLRVRGYVPSRKLVQFSKIITMKDRR